MKVKLEENMVGYITLLAEVLSPQNYATVAVLTVYPLALIGHVQIGYNAKLLLTLIYENLHPDYQ